MSSSRLPILNQPRENLSFDARDGELLGLNLLDMAAQYLPINYNRDLTASRNMNTPYERLESIFRSKITCLQSIK